MQMGLLNKENEMKTSMKTSNKTVRSFGKQLLILKRGLYSGKIELIQNLNYSKYDI